MEILAPRGKTVSPESSLAARFRPVAELAGGAVFGHLASIHGPPEKSLLTPSRLAGVARQLGKTSDLYRRYFQVAVDRFVVHQGQGYLLLPLSNDASVLGEACTDMLVDALAKGGLSSDRVIVVHTGIGGLDGAALERALAAARALRRSGFKLAAGAVTCPRSEKLLWSALHPEFAIIEDGALEGFDTNLQRLGHFPELVATAVGMDRRIIALGINSLTLLKVLRETGVACVAGDFIGRPVTVPTRTLSAAAHKELTQDAAKRSARSQGSLHVLEKMLQRVPPVTPNTPADEVFATFEHTADLRAIAVVKNDIPIGLIVRYEMVGNMARPYRHELYGRKPCTRFMDEDPLTVDIRLPLSELAEVLVSAHPRHLVSGFIITEEGRYLGIGSVQDLVREVTSMQMEAARYANPLSQLPGNVPINQYIDNLLAAGEPCAIAYCDLDHFKPFNDVYGYARGDDVIRLTARILTEVCDTERDFIGHIGGDDFVLVFRDEDWQARCEMALRMFGEEILGFFSRDDVERGGYVTENRKGAQEFHPLTSLSIGVTEVRPGMFRTHLDVAVVAAEVKKKAKGMRGNSLYVNKRTH
jgi:GGDEF domain-containing protein/EAL domain-containing protein (putative c-di-GMP-specific phosphodiesterase class I)